MAVTERLYFRVDYPPPDRPTIMINGTKYIIRDISEKGVKFILNEVEHKFKLKQVLKATITFKDEKSLTVIGRVLRFDQAFVVLFFPDTGIPLARIMQEQRTLIQKYAELKGQNKTSLDRGVKSKV